MPKSKYKFKTKPYSHQRDAVIRLLAQDYGGALFMQPRTGKSKTTIDTLSAWVQKGHIDRAVIVCPNRVIGTWIKEFKVHCPKNYHIQVWDGEARTQTIRTTVNGERVSKRIPQGPTPVTGAHELEVLVMNYEAFGVVGNLTKSGRRGKASGRMKNRQLLRKWLEGGRTAAGVLDESHKIGSPNARASSLIVSMSDDFAKRLILTGTPLTKAKKPEVIWMQWQFLNPDRFKEFPTVNDFRSHYSRSVEAPVGPAIRGQRQRTYKKYLGPKNIEDLKRRMNKDAIIVRREDCFDLPKAEHLVKYVDLKASRKAYDDMAKDMIAHLEDGTIAEAQIALVVNLRLAQITSGFVTNEEGEISRIGFEKMDALKELLDIEMEKEQKVVVAARWKPDLDLIEALGNEIGFKTYSIRGKVKRRDSDEYIERFRTNEVPSLMVVQPQAASMGIDLSTAAHLVWFSNSPRWVDYTQTCDRIALNRNSVTFTHLIARRSYDEVILNTLQEDGDISDKVMSNPQLLMGEPLNLDKFGRLA